MKKTLAAFCSLTALAATAACSPHTSPTTAPPGEYEHTQKSVDRYGTETETTTKTDVYYDQDGNKRAVQEKETTRDPKGLFNKSTTSSTKVYE